MTSRAQDDHIIWGTNVQAPIWRNYFDRSYFTREERYRSVANRYGYNVTKTIANMCYLENFPPCDTNRLLSCLVPMPVA